MFKTPKRLRIKNKSYRDERWACLLEQIVDQNFVGAIQCRGGFIEENHLRLHQQNSSNGNLVIEKCKLILARSDND